MRTWHCEDCKKTGNGRKMSGHMTWGHKVTEVTTKATKRITIPTTTRRKARVNGHKGTLVALEAEWRGVIMRATRIKAAMDTIREELAEK